MLMHARTVAAPRRPPPSLPLEPPEPGAALLESLGAIEAEDNILVLGRDGPNLMCALIRAGARNVTHLCSFDRLEAASTSLVVVPHVASLDWLERALSPVRRALLDNGRIAASVDALATTQTRVRRMLILHGFSAIRVHPSGSREVLTAEVPAFGHHRCA
ncbi:MAG TPA: hypothetical protein VGC09_07165 [Rhodopila sp.]